MMTHRVTHSRRKFTMLAAGAVLGARGSALTAAPQGAARRLNADQSLRELLDGNQRFTAGKRQTPRARPEDYRALAHGQYPQAVIVTCADSRVSPEILFDVGVGDIFVVRVAGNVIDGTGVTLKGSIEYAVAELNVPLVLVLGHTACGAVKAAIQHLENKDSLPGAINGLVELIKPAVASSKGMAGNPLENAIRQNVKVGVQRLQGLDPILAPRVKEGQVKVIGGVYDLATGVVTVLS